MGYCIVNDGWMDVVVDFCSLVCCIGCGCGDDGDAGWDYHRRRGEFGCGPGCVWEEIE